MRKILEGILGVVFCMSIQPSFASDKFDLLPDLPDSLASAALASSVSTVDSTPIAAATQSVGQEPNIISMIFSLVFVIILIYFTGILYTKLNKYGASAFKRQAGDTSSSKVSVLSTTPLGSNKSLHVVELDGKRMLIGASASSIHLIKDLGNYKEEDADNDDVAFSKIEIPNIRIPKIEIPKIEIPGFTRVLSKLKDVEHVVNEEKDEKFSNIESVPADDNSDFNISEIYEAENSEGIIDKLFHTTTSNFQETVPHGNTEHKVDPEEFALYKKYL